MAVGSAPRDPIRDPYELERLAEELVAREKSNGSSTTGISGEQGQHDLPLHPPLSHDNPHLSADEFDVDGFLLSRSHTSLQDLRSELRDYLSSLKEELVKLINDDYEAFISLSTDLRGEGAQLEHLKHPIGPLKAQILESKAELQKIESAFQENLEKRAALREEKALLHLLLKISEYVNRLESLLLITPQEQQDSVRSPGASSVKLPQILSPSHHDGSHATRAKHLARVASEHTQLLYHASKARTNKCVFVDEIQWRIDRIQSTLLSDLDHLFASTLAALIDDKAGKKLSEADRLKHRYDVSECLRTYDVLGLWRDAEEVIRSEVVRPFVKKTIHPGALSGPHSPIVPHTPLAMRFSTSPHTPSAPYLTFTQKYDLVESRSGGGGVSPIPLLEEGDGDDTLARLYNQLLRFVARDLKKFMEMAEEVSVVESPGGGESDDNGASGVGSASAQSPLQESSETQGFSILANVVSAEFCKAIMDELGAMVFAAGRPAEFRQHYVTSQAFFRSLEALAPSMRSVAAMRSHPIYITFQRRWQLPVYFQLRWKGIVNKLEAALSSSQTDGRDIRPFASVQAEAVWDAIVTCWSADVFISELDSRFWRLTLQILRRYRTWLDEHLPSFDAPLKSAASLTDKFSGAPLSRTSTPIPASEAAAAETIAADNDLLRRFAIVLIDVKALNTKMRELWRGTISSMLLETASVSSGKDGGHKDALDHSLAAFLSPVPSISNQVIAILARRCFDSLLPVRLIPSQYRAMANKRLPTEPSHFVASILQPLKSFFSDVPGAHLRDDMCGPYAAEVFNAVCRRYILYISAMKKTEESLRRLKKGQTSTFSLFRSAGGGKDEETRDQERIRTQMIIDVNAFGKDAESLGVDVLGSPAYVALNDMVHANPAEDTTSQAT